MSFHHARSCRPVRIIIPGIKTLREEQVRNLVIVLSDQLNPDSASFEGFDCDAVWMAEVCQKATYVWSPL